MLLAARALKGANTWRFAFLIACNGAELARNLAVVAFHSSVTQAACLDAVAARPISLLPQVHSCVEPDYGMRNSALLIGQMPLSTANAQGDVLIWAGWAEKQGQVYVTQKYVLRCRLADGVTPPQQSRVVGERHGCLACRLRLSSS